MASLDGMEIDTAAGEFTEIVNKKRQRCPAPSIFSLSDSDSDSSSSHLRGKKKTNGNSSRVASPTQQDTIIQSTTPQGPSGSAPQPKTTKSGPRRIPPVTIFPRPSQRIISINKAFLAQYNPQSLTSVKTRDGTKLFVQNPKDYINLQKFVVANDIPHVIFKLREDRSTKFVIRNIDEQTLPVEILDELKRLEFPILRVAQLKSNNHGGLLPMFLVEMTQSKKTDEFPKLRGLLNMSIRVEPYKAPTAPLQCFRCQRYGHGANSCNAMQRCVKCGMEHSAKGCEIPHELFKCALCGENHSASYKGCQIYKNILKAKKQPVKTKPVETPTPTVRKFTSKKVVEGATFASMSGGKEAPKTTRVAPQVSEGSAADPEAASTTAPLRIF